MSSAKQPLEITFKQKTGVEYVQSIFIVTVNIYELTIVWVFEVLKPFSWKFLTAVNCTEQLHTSKMQMSDSFHFLWGLQTWFLEITLLVTAVFYSGNSIKIKKKINQYGMKNALAVCNY